MSTYNGKCIGGHHFLTSLLKILKCNGPGGQMTKAQLGAVLQPVLAADVLLVSNGNPTYRYFAQEAHNDST